MDITGLLVPFKTRYKSAQKTGQTLAKTSPGVFVARLIEAEVWASRPKILTSTAQLVLLRLADSAGTDHRMVWIGIDTLIRDARCARSTVYEALRQLRELNIVVDVPREEWPAEALRYESVVRKINHPSAWAAVYDPVFQQDTIRIPDMYPSGNQNDLVRDPDPNQELLNQEQEVETSSLPISPSGGSTPGKSASDDDLDPAEAVGPYAKPATAPKTGRNPDSAMGLALHLKLALRRTASGRRALMVPDAINYRSLAATLSRWLKEGTTPHQIRAWMDDYAAGDYRSPGAPAWKSFLASRALLAGASIQEAEIAAEVKRMTDLDDPEVLATWGVTAEEIMPWVAA
ncbi:hypothetical protein AB0G15_05445 [Streptosporangium sp. NPDC023825]|uniref:hypothetical protein n=1 Tax=Streptosporangium sp. NPDC023825 TaxID=3154909 RepID=UPI003424DA10